MQVMKMGQALAKLVDRLEIVTVGNLIPTPARSHFDIWRWYGIERPFPVVRLPLRLGMEYPLPKGYRNRFFLPVALAYALLARPDFIYTRTLEAAKWAQYWGLRTLLETHVPARRDDSWLVSSACKGHLIGIVTISPLLSESYVELGVPPEKVLTVEDGVDIERFILNCSRKEAREKVRDIVNDLKLDPEVYWAVYAGNLDTDRRIEDIFYCAAKLPDVQFLLVGGWEESIRIRKKQADDAKLTNVQFTGFIENNQLPFFLYAADVLLMHYSSRIVSAEYMSPMKMFEYMAAQRPILTTDLKPISRILSHFEDAYLVAPDDEVALVDGLKTLLADQDLRDKLSRSAYVKVQQYTWDRRAARVLDCFHEAIEH